jgi:hypothetical protein
MRKDHAIRTKSTVDEGYNDLKGKVRHHLLNGKSNTKTINKTHSAANSADLIA